MRQPVPINLAVEDLLSEAAARRLLCVCRSPVAIGSVYGKSGFGYLRRTARSFNNAAKGTPFLLLTDLDTGECAPRLVADWLGVAPHPNFIFRVAVREVESWILADSRNLPRFLGIPQSVFPGDPDALQDPKATLIQLAAKSPRRTLKAAILPTAGTTARIGPGYNIVLSGFVRESWDPSGAAERSESLRRALSAVSEFTPVWTRAPRIE